MYACYETCCSKDDHGAEEFRHEARVVLHASHASSFEDITKSLLFSQNINTKIYYQRMPISLHKQLQQKGQSPSLEEAVMRLCM